MNCPYKHTKYDPTEEEFKCPKCGAVCGVFCVEEGPNEECLLMHEDDTLHCFECGYTTTGKAFVNKLLKDKSHVECPHCKGKGYIIKPIEGDK